MAGHGGGGGGGHGGGGGGGSKKGLVNTVTGNGCLRYLALYILALFLLLGGLAASALHLIPSLPGLGSAKAGGSTTASITLPAAPTAASAPAPTAVAIQPASNTQAQGGGNPSTAPQTVINAAPVKSGQSGSITPYFAPAFYIVQPGDSLDTIAATYGTTAAKLASYNQLASTTLQPGQVLYLPPADYSPVPNTGRNAGHDSSP